MIAPRRFRFTVLLVAVWALAGGSKAAAPVWQGEPPSLAPVPAVLAGDDRWTSAHIEDLARALEAAWTHGLDPADYPDPEGLRSLEPGPERDAFARAAYLALAEHLAFGRVDARAVEEDWTAPVRDQDLEAVLAEALATGRVFESLADLAPQSPEYNALRGELIRRLTVVETPPLIPAGEPLQRGDQGLRVDALRARLVYEGFLRAPEPAGAPFGARLETALLRYQNHFELTADGVAGPATLAELNAAPERRIDQLKANLERWRWLPQDLGRRHIRVNIADYRLEAWRDGALERVHEVMIGSHYARTPVFSEDMVYLEINPNWIIPQGMSPSWLNRMRLDPKRLHDEGYRLVDVETGRRVSPYFADWSGDRRYRVIQAPHPENAMGEVKFIFPNRHNVYIHDTPHRELFANVDRTESSGCVRVRDPDHLAWWILSEEPGWSRGRMDAVFRSDDTTRIWLDAPVPVHILYFTAAVEDDGSVRLLHDIYGRDDQLIDALYGRLPPATAPASSEVEEAGDPLEPEADDPNALPPSRVVEIADLTTQRAQHEVRR